MKCALIRVVIFILCSCAYLRCVVQVSSHRFHVTGRNTGQGEQVCHLKFLDLVNTLLNDKKFRISRNHFSADK